MYFNKVFEIYIYMLVFGLCVFVKLKKMIKKIIKINCSMSYLIMLLICFNNYIYYIYVFYYLC